MKTNKILLAALALSVTAARGEVTYDDGRFIYEITEFLGHPSKEAVIIGLADGWLPEGELAFPETITVEDKEIPVTMLGWANHVGHETDDPIICGLDNITTVHIPRYMDYIGRVEFRDCPNIAEYVVDPASEAYITIDGALVERLTYLENPVYELIRYPSAATATTYAVPSSVRYVSFGAFAANRHLKKIYLSGDQALQTCWQYNNHSIIEVDCTNSRLYSTHADGAVYYGSILEALCPGRSYLYFDVPETCRYIAQGAFCEADVDMVSFPERVEDALSECVFMNSTVRKVTFLGEAPFTVGGQAFMNCRNLESIVIGTSAQKETVFRPYAFLGCSALSVLELSENARTVRIGARAFEGCRSLKAFPLTSKMKIPELSDRAFAGCESLESFLFGTVGEFQNQQGHQFAGSGLRQVHWPTGHKNVPRGCFAGCTRLEKVYLKETTEDLYEGAFKGSGLIALNMMGVHWYSLSAFKDCPALMRLYFPDNGKYTTYGAVDFKTSDPQVVINNPKIDYLYDQEEYPGVASLYVSMVDGCNTGNGWRTVYVPGRAGDLYRQLTDSEVIEMFEYDTFPQENAVSVTPAVAGVKIIGVRIEGEEAVFSEGKYRVEKEEATPGDSMMNVEISYTVFGNEMRSAYSLVYSSVGNPETDPAHKGATEWYTIDGTKTDGATLTPGIYIRRDGDRASKVILR